MADLPGTSNVAQLMASFRKGDKAAAGKLVEMFYPELRRLAAARMRSERTEHTLQATALINELYLELLKVKELRDADSDDEDERAAFFKLSGSLMRRLLIHHARPLSKQAKKVEVTELNSGSAPEGHALAEIDDALDRLQKMNPQLRTVVELKVFEGLTGEEIATRMGCGTATVTRHWNFARHWLAENFAKD
jgi:RNA polymerase sigma factor (TIGR02999 family)